MLTKAYDIYQDGVAEWFPTLMGNTPETNRLYHMDEERNAAAEALKGPVVQLYYPALISTGSFNVWRCTIDVCAPSFREASELADTPLRDLQNRVEANSMANDPVSQPIIGQGYGRIRVQFDLKVRREV